jgi:hypothetical protein
MTKPVPTADEIANLPETKSYLRWIREEVFTWEVENFRKGVEKFGIRTLSSFCEMVGLNEKYIRAEINKSEKEGNKFCMIDGWKIAWKSIDDVRKELSDKGVAITPRRRTAKGKLLVNKKDFAPGDYELNKLVERFMS